MKINKTYNSNTSYEEDRMYELLCISPIFRILQSKKESPVNFKASIEIFSGKFPNDRILSKRAYEYRKRNRELVLTNDTLQGFKDKGKHSFIEQFTKYGNVLAEDKNTFKDLYRIISFETVFESVSIKSCKFNSRGISFRESEKLHYYLSIERNKMRNKGYGFASTTSRSFDIDNKCGLQQ